MKLKPHTSAFSKAILYWCGFIGLTFTMANATTVIPPTFEEMTDRAELIFKGEVVSSQSEWRTVGNDRVIFTLVKFDAREVLKGQASATVTLQFLGGTVGDRTMEVSGVPKFNVGDRVILFVEKNGAQFCPLVGVFHGKFGVKKDEKTGRDTMVMHDGKSLRDVAEIGAGEGSEFVPNRPKASIPSNTEPMLADTFKAKILDHLGKSAGKK